MPLKNLTEVLNEYIEQETAWAKKPMDKETLKRKAVQLLSQQEIAGMLLQKMNSPEGVELQRPNSDELIYELESFLTGTQSRFALTADEVEKLQSLIEDDRALFFKLDTMR